MSTTVTYKNQIVTTVTNTTKELTTRGKYLEDNIHLTDVSGGGGNLQEKTGVEPSTVSQTLTPDPGYDGFSSVQINAMPTGSEGTPIATKGAVQDHALAVTPSVINTAGYIPGGTRTGAAVNVAASELVSGTLTPDSAGTKDVTNYQYVQLNAGSLSNPTGLKGSVSNHQVSITPRAHYDGGFANTVTKYGTAITVTAAELASGTKEITQNGTGIDVVGYESVNVNVSGGSGWTTDGIASGSEPSGAITITGTGAPTIRQYCFNKCTNITSVTIQGSPYISSHAFRECSGMTTLNAPDLTRIYASNYNTAQYAFQGCSSLQTIVFPNHGNYAVDSYNFQNCTSLTAFDINNVQRFGASVFSGDTNFNTLVIRKSDGVPGLSNVNSFTNTPFMPGNSGGDLYIPKVLYDALGTGTNDYQSTTGWSGLYTSGTLTFHAIEGSYYETHYADGTLIS